MRIHNTLTRRVEELEPLTPGHVRLYTCGPTVYDFAHIGNFRTYVWEDLLRRTLKLLFPRSQSLFTVQTALYFPEWVQSEIV